MSLTVTEAVLNDINLELGDGIGIFDGDICVGAGIVEGTITYTDRLSIEASSQDPQWPDGTGFTAAAAGAAADFAGASAIFFAPSLACLGVGMIFPARLPHR